MKHLQPLTPAALYTRVFKDRQDVDLSVSVQLRALGTILRRTATWRQGSKWTKATFRRLSTVVVTTGGMCLAASTRRRWMAC